MIRAYATATIRQVEYELVRQSPVDQIMKKAAGGVAEACAQLLACRAATATRQRVAALVGGGDNGGDALYALSMLQRMGISTIAVLATNGVHERALAAARDAGVSVFTPDFTAGDRQIGVDVARQVSGCDVLIDGLVGTGGSGPLREPAASIVSVVAAALADAGSRVAPSRRTVVSERHRAATAKPARRPFVVAVDVPSGLGGEDGRVAGPHLVADVTVTMGAPKPCALLAPACHSLGEVRVIDLGLDLPPSAALVRSLQACDVGELWAVPGPGDHKYTRGVAHIVAGSADYPFTGVLCVEAAARCGAGMVRYCGPDDAALAVLTRIPEAVTAPGRFQASLVGPGLSATDEARLDKAAEVVRLCRAARLPIVLDAGALRSWRHLMRSLPQAAPGELAVLTPHAGEAADLLTQFGLGSGHGGVARAEVEAAPALWARRLADETGAVVVLKGAATTVVAPGEVPYVQRHAPAWTGTAGAGDVLAGTVVTAIAAAQARHEEAGSELSLTQLARVSAAAVWIHSTAARLAAGLEVAEATGGTGAEAAEPEPLGAGRPIVATDIVAALPRAVAVALAAGPYRYAG